MTTLYVGNLSSDTSDADLRGLFSRFGKVFSARIALDRETLQPRGFGFVEMASAVEAELATRELRDFELDGRRIVVNEARPKTARYVSAR